LIEPEESENLNSQEDKEEEENEENEENQEKEGQNNSAKQKRSSMKKSEDNFEENSFTENDSEDFELDNDLESQQQNLIDNLNSNCQESKFDIDNCQCLPSNKLTKDICNTCHLQYNECTCTFAKKTIDKDDDLQQSNDKKKRNVEFGNNIQNILSSECSKHPDPCYCTFNKSNEYGYRSKYEFDAKLQPTKRCLTKSNKYGIFHPPIFRPHKVSKETGYITNNYQSQPASNYESANQGIVKFKIDPTKHKVNIIMRNNLPLGIIDDEIPQDVYHHTLNPNRSKDQQSHTEEGAEKQPEQDSGIIDIDTEEIDKEETSENRYNLRKRKSYKEDYKPRSNSKKLD
jgi:hypothetical protein